MDFKAASIHSLIDNTRGEEKQEVKRHVQIVCFGVVGARVKDLSVKRDIGSIRIWLFVDDKILVDAANVCRAGVVDSVFDGFDGAFTGCDES